MGLLKYIVGGAGAYAGMRLYLNKIKLPSEITLPFEEYCQAKGYFVQNHWVETKDGYFLRLFRLSKVENQYPNKSPVLIVHGMTANSKCFVMNQSATPPAFELVENGHDVWFLNCRGNTYSRLHKTLRYEDSEFWNWTATHIGDFDVPATIDYVLQKTGQKKLNYLGHSQGSYAGIHCFSMNPEYGDKVNLAALWSAPCGFLSLNALQRSIGKSFDSLSSHGPVGITLNSQTILKLSTAFPSVTLALGERLLNMKHEDDYIKHLPNYLYNFVGKTSKLNLKFWMQMEHRKSPVPTYFDYGEKENLKIYGSKVPKSLDFDKIRCDLAIFHGKYDQIASVRDLDHLRMQLPKSKIAFFKNDYDIDHMGFLVSKNQSHVNDLLKLLK